MEEHLGLTLREEDPHTWSVVEAIFKRAHPWAVGYVATKVSLNPRLHDDPSVSRQPYQNGEVICSSRWCASSTRT